MEKQTTNRRINTQRLLQGDGRTGRRRRTEDGQWFVLHSGSKKGERSVVAMTPYLLSSVFAPSNLIRATAPTITAKVEFISFKRSEESAYYQSRTQKS